MLRFRRLHSLQKFVSVHSSIHNLFNTERSLSSRPVYKMNRAAALAEWRELCAARRPTPLPRLRRVRIRLTAPMIDTRPDRRAITSALEEVWPFEHVRALLTCISSTHADLPAPGAGPGTIGRRCGGFRDPPGLPSPPTVAPVPWINWRDELLDREIFHSLWEVQILIESWRRHYNAVRRHSALRWTPPAPEVRLPTLQVWPAMTLAHHAPTNYH